MTEPSESEPATPPVDALPARADEPVSLLGTPLPAEVMQLDPGLTSDAVYGSAGWPDTPSSGREADERA